MIKVTSNKFIVAAMLAVVFTPPATAAVNVANGAFVVAGSGDYPNGPFNSGGTYATSNVTDGQNATPDNDAGGITEPGQDGSYWLGQDNISSGFFVIDLGTPQGTASFQLFNTRNGPYDDRGSGNFEIRGSNFLSAVDGPTSSATLLAAGALTPQTYPGPWGSQGNTPLVGDTFASLDATPFQFIRFHALTGGAAADKGFPFAGVGLNEIRVFAVPEPSTVGLVTLAMLGMMRRRRA